MCRCFSICLQGDIFWFHFKFWGGVKQMSKWFEEYKFISTLHDHAGKFHIISLYICIHIHWILAPQNRLLCFFILDRKIRPNLWVRNLIWIISHIYILSIFLYVYIFLHICYMYIKYIYIWPAHPQHLHFLILEQGAAIYILKAMWCS